MSGSDSPNLYADLGEGVRALLSDEGRMNLDRTAALLQVTDRASRLARVEQYLEAVMLRVTRQVQIEAKVIEVELRDEFSAGINWRGVLRRPDQHGDRVADARAGDDRRLHAGAQRRRLQRAAQRVRHAGQGQRPLQPARHRDEQRAGDHADRHAGRVLRHDDAGRSGERADPAVDGDAAVADRGRGAERHAADQRRRHHPHEHQPEHHRADRRGDVAPRRQVPIVSVRETDTLVRVRQGETIVIAGLMQDRTSVDTAKVPLLGDVPVVGNLFKRTEKTPQEDRPRDPADADDDGPGRNHRHHRPRDPAAGRARARPPRPADDPQMYEPYYGFAEKPFSLTPDPKYLYRSESHANAFELLQYAIDRREGFVVITGDIGTGKTTLCRALLEQTDKKTFTALLLNPFLSEEDLLKAILQDLGVVSRGDERAGGRQPSKQELINTLHDFLLSLIPLGARAVLIIDEAQNLPLPILEQIRILSNLETDKEKLLQIILVGQLNLVPLLRSPELRQLDQRVSIRYQLKPLTDEETGAYVSHRLAIANGARSVVFTPAALNSCISTRAAFRG